VPGIPGGPHYETVKALAFSPDGKRLAVSGTAAFRGPEGGDRIGRRAAVWDIRDKDAVHERTLPEIESAATGFGFTAEGKELVVGYQNGGVRWWDLTADPPREVRRLESHPREVTAVAVSPDGKEFATGSGEVRRGKVGEQGKVVIDKEWAVRTDQLQFTPDGRLLLVMFNTGRFAAVDRGGKVVIDLRPGQEPGDSQFHSAVNRGFGLTADGRHVAVPTSSGLVYILRLKK
jgi:WD40 repeat protein